MTSLPKNVSLFFFRFVFALVQNFWVFAFERFCLNSDSLINELIVMARHEVFEQNLISKRRLIRFKVSKFGHNVANSPRKNLPFILPLARILLQQVFVGQKGWQNVHSGLVRPSRVH